MEIAAKGGLQRRRGGHLVPPHPLRPLGERKERIDIREKSFFISFDFFFKK
jgi:hypothetical protein